MADNGGRQIGDVVGADVSPVETITGGVRRADRHAAEGGLHAGASGARVLAVTVIQRLALRPWMSR
jgi:hypothetical protein